MTELPVFLGALLADLVELGVEPCLVGGLAVSVRTETRFTQDIDLALAISDDAQVEQLVFQLQQRGYELVALIEQTAVDRIATLRLARTSDRETIADLLVASSGIEAEIVQAGEDLEGFPGQFVRVAPIGHLLAMKVLSRDDATRPQGLGGLRTVLARETDRGVLARACQRGSGNGVSSRTSRYRRVGQRDPRRVALEAHSNETWRFWKRDVEKGAM